MEFEGVRIVDVEPMSDVMPVSDSEIARRGAKIMEDLMVIADHYPGVPREALPWQSRDVYDKLKRRLSKLHRDHAKSVELFDNWINAGKPDIARRPDKDYVFCSKCQTPFKVTAKSWTTCETCRPVDWDSTS